MTVDEYYAKIKEYSDLFVTIEAIVNRAIKLCPTDKKGADVLFNNAQDQFNQLLVSLDTLQKQIKTPEFKTTINGIRISVNNAISNADVARKRCQNSPPVVSTPVTANTANTSTTTTAVPTPPPTPAPVVNTNQRGLTASTRDQAAVKNVVNFEAKKDWRVRLSLAPSATYLYMADNPGILMPLKESKGVIFPYTPAISVQYNAKYDPTSLTHTNYTFFNYTGSSVDQVQITCDFTAQDTQEANYLLAVIHFFRTATKMFYGQDEDPKPGTPPPLCYVTGYGQFQFNEHPLVISGFTYSLPDDCDYIRASSSTNPATSPDSATSKSSPASQNTSNDRLSQGSASIGSSTGQVLARGGNLSSTRLQDNKGFNSVVPTGTADPTYVPTKIQLQITCLPIVSRYDVSNQFSLTDYATGALLKGVTKGTGGGRSGGFW